MCLGMSCLGVFGVTESILCWTHRRCNTLQHAATRSNTLQHNAVHCTDVNSRHTAKHCNVLQHTVTHRACVNYGLQTLCNTLQHTLTCCNTAHLRQLRILNKRQHHAIYHHILPHTTTHCKSLPHTATHYKTLQPLVPASITGSKHTAQSSSPPGV